ncbi:acyl-CoA-binding domain-containing protein 2-like [Hevea brasiliensis]|uniref:acyl-CoA-binding domain-containing protein 2-like n=1 Tax=Hevea brasiliensis TaxID=3981 RepID=UPI0025EEBE6A|nr:acyl-CoA-binding domain-containing protein 2-like [Hevea brasiliensis]
MMNDTNTISNADVFVPDEDVDIYIYISINFFFLEEEFKEFAEKATSLPPTKDVDKLILYGLFKQATVGAVNTNRPGIFSLTERAKWDAWKAVEGKTKQQAMAEYITKVKQLQGSLSSTLKNISIMWFFCENRSEQKLECNQQDEKTRNKTKPLLLKTINRNDYSFS